MGVQSLTQLFTLRDMSDICARIGIFLSSIGSVSLSHYIQCETGYTFNKVLRTC